MFLNKDIIGEYLTFYKDLNLKISFGDGESISVDPYKYGYLVTKYNLDIPENQHFMDTWNQAISKFEEITELNIKECIKSRRTNEIKEVEKHEQLEFPFN